MLYCVRIFTIVFGFGVIVEEGLVLVRMPFLVYCN